MTSKSKVLTIVLATALITGAGVWLWLANKSNDSLHSDTRLTDGQAFVDLDYVNEEYGFSFQHPEGFKVSEFEEETGEVILAGDKFQIFITPFDESGAITPELIKKDLPSAVVENPTLIKVANTDALSFIGQGDNFKTAEVWFVYPPESYPNGNYLYQLTAKLEEAKLLEEILKTWKFQ